MCGHISKVAFHPTPMGDDRYSPSQRQRRVMQSSLPALTVSSAAFPTKHIFSYLARACASRDYVIGVGVHLYVSI